MKRKKLFLVLGVSILTCAPLSAQNLFEKNRTTAIYVGQTEETVVQTALSILQTDVENVFQARLERTTAPQEEAGIVAGTIGQPEFQSYLEQLQTDISSLKGKWEAFQISTTDKGQVVVAGSDARGLAYGLLEISRMIGVSPWEWWADVRPDQLDHFPLSDVKEGSQAPSVQFRGIFLNDEDWGLNPWSTQNFEPEAKTIRPLNRTFKGQVGPKTYARIFELLLRLRANTIWPAMHEVTVPFYFVEGNRETAERYGIVVSTSHCEPLMRNSATEWDLAGKGEYNFMQNRQAVTDYWADRLKELGHSENIFTMGMRGKHDGRMIGVRNTEEYKEALTQVLQAQDSLLKRYIHPQSQDIPQQFIPYKEVLDVYRAGLEVPGHITLVWPDDNFGYIRHFPTEEERQRPGGNGVYYHTSYWGEPHDFLWLGIVQPALMYQQMKLAYDRGMRKIWILNVGDIKPSEYLTELFLDLAWDIRLQGEEAGGNVVNEHLGRWLRRTFGPKAANRLLPMMEEFYRLSHVRKPEFLGNTRVYAGGYEHITDLPWTAAEIDERLSRFNALSNLAEDLRTAVPDHRQEAYFEMIQYPVQASSEMNRKILYAQLARHTPADSTALWQKSDAAYDSIAALTRRYNALLNGKWNHMMDFRPRRLTVFGKVPHTADPRPLKAAPEYIAEWNGTEFASASGGHTIINGLGHEGKALCMARGETAEYTFKKPAGDSLTVEVRLVPVHAVEGGRLRFSVSVDGAAPQTFDCETAEYSEEWKTNILRAQAIKTAVFPVTARKGRVSIQALDEDIVLDQIKIR